MLVSIRRKLYMQFGVELPAFVLYIYIYFSKKIVDKRNLWVCKIKSGNGRLTDTPQD